MRDPAMHGEGEAADALVPPDDEALIERVAGGDRRAFRLLYERHARRVLAFVGRRLSDASEAEDVLHEAMLEVWRGAGRYRGGSAVPTWILGIAAHKTADRLRTRKPEYRAELDEGIPDGRLGGFDLVAAEDEAAALRACLGDLPAAMREAVHLVFFQSLRYAEVALVLACAEGTVKARIHHAKRALKTCLGRRGIGAPGEAAS
ncbi:MAG: sigma-70 family RNA polymerase sigma factor [Geminicoccaceae bacterium]|nr:sigma-70 family RNA polymerase sigma factor [Geminicoccaceae bacterium]